MSMPSFLAAPDLPGAAAFERWGDHRHLAVLLGSASRIMVLSGAGLSAPSGIPTYRGPGGKWTVATPVEHDEFLNVKERRLEQWRRTVADMEAFGAARPNAGHEALARLASRTDLFVATQNVDGLHAESGLSPERLVELHGNGRRVRCVLCEAVTPLDVAAVRARVDDGRSPLCGACGAILKPDVTLFGADLDREVLARARREAEACIVFVAVGSSLTVHPAAGLLETAARNGAVIVIAVDTVTPYHGAAHLLLAGDASAHLDAAVPR